MLCLSYALSFILVRLDGSMDGVPSSSHPFCYITCSCSCSSSLFPSWSQVHQFSNLNMELSFTSSSFASDSSHSYRLSGTWTNEPHEGAQVFPSFEKMGVKINSCRSTRMSTPPRPGFARSDVARAHEWARSPLRPREREREREWGAKSTTSLRRGIGHGTRFPLQIVAQRSFNPPSFATLARPMTCLPPSLLLLPSGDILSW